MPNSEHETNSRCYICVAVSAVSDGLEAWEILKRRHNNIDLILTELDLPSISGYALLTLIMEHDGCKNIPVVSKSHKSQLRIHSHASTVFSVMVLLNCGQTTLFMLIKNFLMIMQSCHLRIRLAWC